jgi:perosamine synthetase
MVVSRSADVADRVRDLRQYDHRNDYRERYNYKMTDMAAAMGIVQLERLGEFLAARKEIAACYDATLSDPEGRLPLDRTGRIYFRYLIEIAKDPDHVGNQLRRHGIRCARPIFKPLHKYFTREGYPETEKAYEHYLSLPIYPSLGKETASRIGILAAAVMKGKGG